MKTLFGLSAALTLMLGIAWLFVPGAMLSLLGGDGDALAVYMSRRYGALFFGYAALLWLARGSESSPARTAILAGGTLVTTVIAVVSLMGIVTGVAGPGIWSAFVVEVLLAGSFGYYLARRR